MINDNSTSYFYDANDSYGEAMVSFSFYWSSSENRLVEYDASVHTTYFDEPVSESDQHQETIIIDAMSGRLVENPNRESKIDSKVPTIPQKPRIPGKLEPAVKALAQSAYLFRGIFVESANGILKQDVGESRTDAIARASEVIDEWISYFGLDEGNIDHPEK
jgi:hypothetical protein